MKKKNKILIIDGFNVLRSGNRYKNEKFNMPDYEHDWFNHAREKLINDVLIFAGKEWNPIIVFDGAENKNSNGEATPVGGAKIVFSKQGESADQTIEKLAYEERLKENSVCVVSSDAAIQDTVFGLGVDRMSAQGFSRELEYCDTEMHQDELVYKPKKKSTIADRINSKTLQKLINLRDNS